MDKKIIVVIVSILLIIISIGFYYYFTKKENKDYVPTTTYTPPTTTYTPSTTNNTGTTYTPPPTTTTYTPPPTTTYTPPPTTTYTPPPTTTYTPPRTTDPIFLQKFESWGGYYTQFGVNQPMSLNLMFDTGLLFGDGVDNIGKFELNGSYSNDLYYKVSFIKSYSEYNVSYNGTFTDNTKTSISGTWTLGNQTENFKIHKI